MSQEDFIQAIFESLNNESEEIRKSGESKLLAYTADKNIIHLILEILMTREEDKIRYYSVVYAYKTISSFWVDLDFPERAELRDMVLRILSNISFSEEVTNILLDSVAFIYSHDETHWPELIEFVQSITGSPLCLMISKKIILGMHEEVVESSKDYFNQLSLTAMNSEDLKIQLLGVSIYHEFVLTAFEKGINLGWEDHLPSLIQILFKSPQFNVDQMTIVWSCVNDISVCGCVPDEVFPQIAEIAIQIAQNKEIIPIIRFMPIDALSPKTESLTESNVVNILMATIDIAAAMIETDNNIDDESLKPFDTIASMLDHETLYPIIQSQIQQAFESQSLSHQISGLLVFKTLLERFSDLIFNELDTVLNFISNALTSDEDLLKEASLRVIATLCGSYKSANAITPKLVPLIFPNLTSPSPDVRLQAFKALCDISENLDLKIQGFLEQVLQISGQVPPESFIQYLSLIAIIVNTTDEFTDDDCDKIINIINMMIETKESDNIAVCFEIAVSLLHQDESQIDYVVENLFPFIERFLVAEKDDDAVIEETFDFIGNLTYHLRENSFQYFQSFIPLIIEYLESNISNIVKSAVVINVAKLAKFSGENAAVLIPHLVKNIKLGLKSDEDYTQVQSADAIKKIKRFLDPPTAKELFDILIESLQEAPGYDSYINDYLLASSKLLIIADESNISYFLAKTVQYIQSIFNNSWELLKGKPLVQCPDSNDIFQPLCHLFSAVFHFKTDINDDICKFLIQWMQNKSETDLFEIVGTLSDCLLYKNVSDQMREVILNSVIQIMGNANEPSLLQNLAFLMNILVQDEQASALLPSIVELIPTFEKWRQISENSKFGYQEVIANIASLYLQMALRCPEFPDKLIIFSIQQFPPYDINETSSMAEAIMQLVKTKQNSEIYLESAMAFTNFFLQEESKVNKAKVRPELKLEMIQFLKQICAQESSILVKIKASYGRQKSKIRKIEALLNS